MCSLVAWNVNHHSLYVEYHCSSRSCNILVCRIVPTSRLPVDHLQSYLKENQNGRINKKKRKFWIKTLNKTLKMFDFNSFPLPNFFFFLSVRGFTFNFKGTIKQRTLRMQSHYHYYYCWLLPLLLILWLLLFSRFL